MKNFKIRVVKKTEASVSYAIAIPSHVVKMFEGVCFYPLFNATEIIFRSGADVNRIENPEERKRILQQIYR